MAEEEIETERPVFIRGRVPESVRARFKAACALRSQDMGEVLGELIMKWLDEHEPTPMPTTKAKRSKGWKVKNVKSLETNDNNEEAEKTAIASMTVRLKA